MEITNEVEVETFDLRMGRYYININKDQLEKLLESKVFNDHSVSQMAHAHMLCNTVYDLREKRFTKCRHVDVKVLNSLVEFKNKADKETK